MAKKLTRRDVLVELARIEQELVDLEEQRGDFGASVDPAAALALDSKIAAAVRVRDSLVRQITMEDQSMFNRRQVWINLVLAVATVVIALFTALIYCGRA